MFNFKLFITELADKIVKDIKYNYQVCHINKDNDNV